MLILKPVGRGNWSTIDLVISGTRSHPLLFQPGQTITLGGIVWRICKVGA